MDDQIIKKIKNLIAKDAYSKALILIKEKISAEEKNEQLWIYYWLLAETYYKLGRNNEAMEAIQETLTLKNEVQIEKKQEIDIQILYAKILRRNNKHEEAKKIYLNLLDNESKNITKENEIKIYHNLANIYLETRNFKESEKLLQKALNLAEEVGDEKYIATIYSSLGALQYLLGDTEKAVKNYSTSLELREKLEDIAGLANTNFNIGTIYANIQNREKAEKYLFSSINLFEKIENQKGVNITKETLATMYYNLGENEKVIEFLNHLRDLQEYTPKQLPKIQMLIESSLLLQTHKEIEVILEKTMILLDKLEDNLLEKYWENIFQIRYYYVMFQEEKQQYLQALDELIKLEKETIQKNDLEKIMLIGVEKAKIYEILSQKKEALEELERIEKMAKKQKRNVESILTKIIQLCFLLGNYKKAAKKVEELKEITQNEKKDHWEIVIRSLRLALKEKITSSKKLIENSKNIDFNLLFFQDMLYRIQNNSLKMKNIDKNWQNIEVTDEEFDYSNYLLIHHLLTKEELNRETYLKSKSVIEQIYRRVIENQILSEEFREHFENKFQNNSWSYKEKSKILDILCVGILNDLISKNVFESISWKNTGDNKFEELLSLKKNLFIKLIEAHSKNEFILNLQSVNKEVRGLFSEAIVRFVDKLTKTLPEWSNSRKSKDKFSREDLQIYLFIIVKIAIETVEHLFLVDVNEI